MTDHIGWFDIKVILIWMISLRTQLGGIFDFKLFSFPESNNEMFKTLVLWMRIHRSISCWKISTLSFLYQSISPHRKVCINMEKQFYDVLVNLLDFDVNLSSCYWQDKIKWWRYLPVDPFKRPVRRDRRKQAILSRVTRQEPTGTTITELTFD